MKFEILEAQKQDKYFEISTDKNCLKLLKKEKDNYDKFLINAENLALDKSLYGSSKKESIDIQKANCKQILALSKICIKAVKILKKNKAFDGKFYVLGLSNKKNNNDFMIVSMLDVKFNYNAFQRLSKAIELGGEFLDKENTINNMCDFKDNLCVCHRDKNKTGSTGCCPSFCKHTKAGVCTQKCLSCKIFMCDYLIYEKGYYFTPHTVPILKKHLTILERFICFGLLFKTQKQTARRIWGIRALEVLYFAVIALVVALICI